MFNSTFFGMAKPKKEIYLFQSIYPCHRESGKRKVPALGWFTQDETEDTVTKVSSSVSRDTGKPQTEFVIADKNSGDNHTHVAIDQDGNLSYGRSGT